MEIYLSQFAGFCDGVKRAYEMVASLDLARTKKPIYILGSLVHNPDVIRKIEEKGIKKIDLETFLNSRPGEIGTLIITAHGVGPAVFEIAREKNIKIIDTTCPKVIKAQRLAQSFSRRGYKIILVGDKGHKEVNGINEWADKSSQIVSSEADFEKLKLTGKNKIAILSQTTQSEDFFQKTADFIKNKFPQIKVLSTICHTTHQRQNEIKKLAKDCEVVVVIGSKESANSTRLFEIARGVNPRSHFIENADGLEREWFSGLKKVAVTAGASTPDWIIEEVVRKITRLK
jgi:(E)-4-hydroxy-3-methyl-but-2-enyl pyrophosphate reductase